MSRVEGGAFKAGRAVRFRVRIRCCRASGCKCFGVLDLATESSGHRTIAPLLG